MYHELTVTLVSFVDRAAALKPMDFIIEGETFKLNADAQIWPPAYNSLINGDEGTLYSIFSTYGNTFSFQFILGFTFLYALMFFSFIRDRSFFFSLQRAFLFSI